MTAVRILLILMLAGASVFGIEVEQAVWGFSGKAVPGRMNIVSVLVTNKSVRPFDAVLFIERDNGMGEKRGARIAESCFLSPGSSRWVQFCVFVQEYMDEWYLSWGIGPGKKTKLPACSLAPPACVFLHDQSNVFGGKTGLRRFPEQLFPASVTATDSLGSVVLDHVPSWEKPQRTAFSDWVHRGGTVHLLLSDSGGFPYFRGDLDFLNGEGDRHTAGAGSVIRHTINSSDCSADYLARQGFPKPEFLENDNSYLAFDTSALASIGDFGRGKHPWGLIYTMVVLYILLVGPVNYLIGRKSRRYYAAIVFFGICVILFTFIFMQIGRSGYGSESKARSMTYARRIGPGEYDLSQWVSVFAARGDYYSFTSPSPSAQFSTCQDFEKVNAVIKNGLNPVFQVDIPVFSKRGFLRRCRQKITEMEPLSIETVSAGEYLSELKIRGRLGNDAEPVSSWVWYNGYFYPLRYTNGVFTMINKNLKGTQEFFKESEFEDTPDFMMESDSMNFPETAGKLRMQLMARAFGGLGFFNKNWNSPLKRKGLLHVFIYASSPHEMRLNHPDFPQETGFVLLHAVFPTDVKETIDD